MSFWTLVFLTCVAGMVFGYLKFRMELKHGARPESRDGAFSQAVNFGNADPATLQSIEKKLEQMEQRLQSLETIVIEGERHRAFDNALNQ